MAISSTSEVFSSSWHVAYAESKGEDLAMACGSKQFSCGISMYAVADGHNGAAAAKAVAALLPGELERQLDGVSAPSDQEVRQALARAFVSIDDAVCRQFFRSGARHGWGWGWGHHAGTTACSTPHLLGPTLPPPPAGCTLTAAVVCGDTLTLANVGDSHAMLDTGAEVVQLTQGACACAGSVGGMHGHWWCACSPPANPAPAATSPPHLSPAAPTDHRIGSSPSEMARLEQAGGRLARLTPYGTGPSMGTLDGVGPVRLWPGGIMVGRAIGDRDVGDILLPHPHIRQLRIPATGARLVLATDGLWDTVPTSRLARILRQHGSAKSASMQAVSSAAAQRNGLLSDDVTVVVLDLLPPGTPSFRHVLSQFQSRMKTVLSNPTLATLALADAEAQGVEQQQQQAEQQQPPTPRRGLLACFGRPAVVEGDAPSGAGTRGAGVRADFSAYSAREISARGGSLSSRSLPADLGSSSARLRDPATSLRGGTERSMRGGLARDPSVHGASRAATVELLLDADTALWAPADFGRGPSLLCQRMSRDSDDSVHRSSPRGLLEGVAQGVLGASIGSLCSGAGLGPVVAASSRCVPLRLHCQACHPHWQPHRARAPCPPRTAEDDMHSQAAAHAQLRCAAVALQSSPRQDPDARPLHSMSLAATKPAAAQAPLPRKTSAPAGASDKKCRGGNAAAQLLLQS